MKRQIKFRGKRIDNGEWLYGDILRLNDHVLIAPHDGDWYDFMPPKSAIGTPSGKYEVDPDTVGQSTGLKDKNGKEIFDGDIIISFTIQEPRWLSQKSIQGVVVWDSYGFGLKEGNMDGSWLFDENQNDIIVNIHDNPELLKGK